MDRGEYVLVVQQTLRKQVAFCRFSGHNTVDDITMSKFLPACCDLCAAGATAMRTSHTARASSGHNKVCKDDCKAEQRSSSTRYDKSRSHFLHLIGGSAHRRPRSCTSRKKDAPLQSLSTSHSRRRQQAFSCFRSGLLSSWYGEENAQEYLPNMAMHKKARLSIKPPKQDGQVALNRFEKSFVETQWLARCWH